MKLYKVYQIIEDTLLVSYAVAENVEEVRDNYSGVRNIDFISDKVEVLENL